MTEFQRLLEEAGYKTRGYSGRGSWGSCLGIIIPATGLGDMIADVIQSLRERDIDSMTICDEFRVMKTDSMGQSDIVVYFPGIEYIGNNV